MTTQRIGTNRIANNSIVSEKIANNSIVSEKIANNAITSDKLAPGSALPSQTGNATYYLTTDGTNATWKAQTELAIDSSAISNGDSQIAVLDSGSGTIRINVDGSTITTMNSSIINHEIQENALIRTNPKSIISNITMSNSYNYMSVGPITIANGITVTISPDAEWSIM
jgi:hypothetical protein